MPKRCAVVNRCDESVRRGCLSVSERWSGFLDRVGWLSAGSRARVHARRLWAGAHPGLRMKRDGLLGRPACGDGRSCGLESSAVTVRRDSNQNVPGGDTEWIVRTAASPPRARLDLTTAPAGVPRAADYRGAAAPWPSRPPMPSHSADPRVGRLSGKASSRSLPASTQSPRACSASAICACARGDGRS